MDDFGKVSLSQACFGGEENMLRLTAVESLVTGIFGLDTRLRKER